MFHRIVNDKLVGFEKSLLSGSDRSHLDGYKHQVIGFSRSNSAASFNRGSGNFFNSKKEQVEPDMDLLFPQLRDALDCVRSECDSKEANTTRIPCFLKLVSKIRTCEESRVFATQNVASLISSLDSAAAVIQSPFFPSA